MAEMKDCKWFEYVNIERKGLGKDNVEYVPTISCKINKMLTEGCPKDCRWYEPK